VIVRPVRERLRAVSTAFVVALAVALVAVPVYVLVATAQFALRPWYDVGALVPLLGVSAFGRGMLRLELMLALFGFAACVALWLDRPERGKRSVAALLALWGALLAGGATLLAPGAAGHAAQTAPRWLSIALDWTHLAGGSIWVGGLVGLLVLWRSAPLGMAVSLPRFSNAAFLSVLAVIGSGTGASVIHLPTVASLWETPYGEALLVKIGLLAVALVAAAVNLVRTRRGVLALRGLVAGEAALAAGIVLAAAVLSSEPPPAKALAHLGSPAATTGPGPVTSVVNQDGYRFELHVDPNRVGLANDFAVRVLRDGKPVNGLGVTATFTMLDMDMPTQTYALAGAGNGLYERSAPALVMVGRWAFTFEFTPPGGQPFDVLVVDHASG
ncbi:MAG: CopD family protein, partial [Actinobacteria bacterium]|nr:CopD family protein [Actinomycetota bacterium]